MLKGGAIENATCGGICFFHASLELRFDVVTFQHKLAYVPSRPVLRQPLADKCYRTARQNDGWLYHRYRARLLLMDGHEHSGICHCDFRSEWVREWHRCFSSGVEHHVVSRSQRIAVHRGADGHCGSAVLPVNRDTTDGRSAGRRRRILPIGRVKKLLLLGLSLRE